MSPDFDITVRELGSACLCLRGDLVFTPEISGAQPYYLIEDPLNSRFFRLGHAEYTFLSLLNGQRSLGEAFRQLSTVLPQHHLTESDLAGMSRWLVEVGLVTNGSRPACSGELPCRRATEPAAWTRWNPLVFRLPLAWPDRWFELLTRKSGWLFSAPVGAVWLLTLCISLYQIAAAWPQFVNSAHGVFASDNWLWLGACWVVLKMLHEMSHGIVCKRYGGTVRELGIQMILLAPLAYIDVTSSWRFRSRWQRIHVAAAGMYSELLVAAMAGLVWSHTEPGWLNNVGYNLVITAGLSTILFNANPLMRFDGYFILSDWLGIPNLSTLGTQYLVYLARRLVLGVPGTPPCWPEGKGTMVRAYAMASLVWRCLALSSLAIAAMALFQGAGVVLACAAAVPWLGLPLLRLAQYVIWGKPGERPHRLRFLAFVAATGVTSVFVFGYLPWPGAREAPAIVDYSPPVVVRAGTAGFVSRILVQCGEYVQPKQPLLILENRELVRDVAQLELEIRQSELRQRQLEQKGHGAAQQAEARHLESLASKLAEKRAEVELLTVQAPLAGRVVRRQLDALLGTYLNIGDEVVCLGNEDQKELRVSIAQDDLQAYVRMIGQPLGVDLPRLPLRKNPLEKVIPRASVALPHPALSAAYGGMLATRAAAHHAGDDAREAHELFAPRFTGIVKLSPADSRSLRVGQRGLVSCRPLDETIGEHLYYALYDWFRTRLEHAMAHDR